MLFSFRIHALEIALSFDDAPLASGPDLMGIEHVNKLIEAKKLIANIQEAEKKIKKLISNENIIQ